MTKTRVIRVFSFIMALTLVFAMFTSPAYALSKQQFAAWCAAALQAINITATASGMAAADASRDLMDYLATPYRIVLNQFVDVPYTTPVENIDEYMNRSVIQIDKDTVTIDGVKYTDVWLSNKASEKFRVNAFDLENAFDIASQSEGTFVSGDGTFNGIPIYNVDGEKRSVDYLIAWPPEYSSFVNPYRIGNFDVSTKRNGIFYYFNNAIMGGGSDDQFGNDGKLFMKLNDQDQVGIWRVTNPRGTVNTGGAFPYSEYYDGTPFDFDWVSSQIPANVPLNPDEGLRIRVPTEDITQWYTDNPDIGPNVTINMGDPELSAKIDDLIDLIIPLIPILDIDFTKQAPVPEPIPDPEPYPDPLPDPDISIIDSTLKDIIQALKNIFDNISIGNSIISAIKNLGDQIKWVLDDILDKIGDLVDKIVRGNIDWFSDLIDAIKTPFLPWLNIFKLGVNIWHYVVTWVQNITAPFSYFWNILGSISSIFYSPIYAVAAASIVIAIYRRFGR